MILRICLREARGNKLLVYGRHQVWGPAVRIFVLAGIVFLTLWRSSAAADNPVNCTREHVAGTWANVLRVHLQDPRVYVVPLLAPGGGRASLGRIVSHYRPVAAINGTFFDTRSYRITGNLARDGQLLTEGYIGNAFALDSQNRPCVIHNTGHMGRHTQWSKYRAAIGCGPTLLEHGTVCLHPRQEGFRDPGLFRLAARSAIGYTDKGDLLLVNVTAGISLHRLAEVMRALGARDALSLDGGCSAAMYYRGATLCHPHRLLTNVLAVYDDGASEKAILRCQSLAHEAREVPPRKIATKTP